MESVIILNKTKQTNKIVINKLITNHTQLMRNGAVMNLLYHVENFMFNEISNRNFPLSLNSNI